MQNGQVLAYLRENKEKFSREMLVEQLKASGYPEADIAEGVSNVYGGSLVESVPSWNFWDFKTIHTYRSSSEKTRDALFGFFIPTFFFVVPLIGFPLDLFFLIYFWGRRRYIAYGVLDRWAVLFCGILLFAFLFSSYGEF